MTNKLFTIRLTEQQNFARVYLQHRHPEINLSEYLRDALGQLCEEHDIRWPDNMPSTGNPEWVQQAQDLEDLMDIQGERED